ncbi:hypothetical protein [Rhizobium leguminosarum]|uniref:hypothetical protein n=1 Tax=Rhizobium leguminosarum TaxID=384 RepID=UPI002E139988|nr:hypothetical protein U8Q02_36695 [Rhizobium leguminosarum]
MAENLASELKKALGVDVIRRDEGLVRKLASSLAPKLWSAMAPTILKRDAATFAEQVRAAVDEPGFDLAFSGVLSHACEHGLIGSTECDMLVSVAKNAAAECNVVQTRGEDEYFVMFAIPVQGDPDTLDELFHKGDGAEMLADVVRQSGFVTEGVEVGFLPALFNPGDLSEAYPSAIRHAAASIGLSMLADNSHTAFKRAAKSVSARLTKDEPMMDWHDRVTGTDIRVVLGGYIQKGLISEMKLDALLMSVGKYADAPGYLAERRREFMDRADNSLGVRFGSPSLVPRVVCDLAFVAASTSLLNDAGEQGFVTVNDPNLDPEDVLFCIEHGGLVVLAKFEDGIANSEPISYQMIAGDLDHFQKRLRSIHPAARPLLNDEGELAHGTPGRLV